MPIAKLFAGLRNAAGTKETTIEAVSLRETLEGLVAKFPALQSRIWDGSMLRPYVVITINGYPLNAEQGLEACLEPGDTVAIFPPIAGGCRLSW